jgi:hypothetical protein
LDRLRPQTLDYLGAYGHTEFYAEKRRSDAIRR